MPTVAIAVMVGTLATACVTPTPVEVIVSAEVSDAGGDVTPEDTTATVTEVADGGHADLPQAPEDVPERVEDSPSAPSDIVGDEVEGGCVTDQDCDDGETPICWTQRCEEGTCVAEVDDGAPCEDDDPCTWDVCQDGTCGVTRGSGLSPQALAGSLEAAVELADEPGVLAVGHRATNDTGDESAVWVMKLKPSGLSDNTFPDLGSSAQAIALRGDGQLVMGGYGTAEDETTSPFLVQLSPTGTNPEPMVELTQMADGVPAAVMEIVALEGNTLILGGHSLQHSALVTQQGMWVSRLEEDTWTWTRQFIAEQKGDLALAAMSPGPSPDFNTEERRLTLAGFLSKVANKTTNQWATAIGLTTGSDVEQNWVYQAGQQQKNEGFLDVVTITHNSAVALGWSDKNGAEVVTLDIGGQDHLVTLLAEADPKSRVSTGLFLGGGSPYHLIAGELSVTPGDEDSETKLWVAQLDTADFSDLQFSDTTAQETIEPTQGSIHPRDMISLKDGGVLLVGEHGDRGAWWFLDADGQLCSP